MHTQENIETIHASLGALEGAFQEFKSNQENKFQQLQTAMRRPVIAGEAKSVSGRSERQRCLYELCLQGNRNAFEF